MFGAGNSGAGHQVRRPTLVVMFGWQMVPQVYAAAMLITAIAFWFFTYDDPGHRVHSR